MFEGRRIARAIEMADELEGMATSAHAKNLRHAHVKEQSPSGYRRWDAARYLNSEEDLAACFDAVMEEAADDPAYIAAVLSDMARARHVKACER